MGSFWEVMGALGGKAVSAILLGGGLFLLLTALCGRLIANVIAHQAFRYTLAVVGSLLLLAGVILCATSVVASLSTPSREASAVEVSARDGWQNTGIQVEAGWKIHIVYVSGLWKVASWAEYTDAQGHARQEGYVPEFAHGCLIAKVGNGSVVKVGNDGSFTADRSDSVYLRVNDADEWLNDNVGEITVRVEVTPSE